MDRVLFAPRELPALPPDVSQDPSAYAPWVAERERARVRRTRRARHAPIVLVVVVEEESPEEVTRTLASLGTQTTGRWSLTLAASAARERELTALVRAALPRRMRQRARIVGITGGTARDRFEAALVGRVGSPVALLTAGDAWAPDAVALLGAAIGPGDVVYADDDAATTGGGHVAPRLKPDFSPDFLVSSSYVGRPLLVGGEVAGALPRLEETDLAAIEQEWTLAACATAAVVHHIPEVLCHRSGVAVSDPGASVRVAQRALRRHDEVATAEPGPVPGTVRVVRPAPQDVAVSIVIPFRDQPRFLRTCVDSITATTPGQRAELVLIDNGSTDPEVLTLLERLGQHPAVEVMTDARPFNWAALNNAGARAAHGDVLLFLNNDIEARRVGWLSALAAQAVRPDVGVAGARLLYPDGRLQHGGIVVGMNGAAGHPLVGLREGAPGYLDMAVLTRECSAVTGACMVTRRAVFDELEGFDETLGVDLNDVDYCLRAQEAGYRVVYEPGAELVHHESPSRGTAGGVGDIVRFVERWKDYIARGDPYFNPHLTRADPSCRLKAAEEEDAWKQWYSTVTLQ